MIGYSWGGEAAFDAAEKLKRNGYDVDVMLLLDPELAGRNHAAGIWGAHASVPSNVEDAVEFKAHFSTDFGNDTLNWLADNFQDGETQIEGALRVDLPSYVDTGYGGESQRIDHQTMVQSPKGHEYVSNLMASYLMYFYGQYR